MIAKNRTIACENSTAGSASGLAVESIMEHFNDLSFPEYNQKQHFMTLMLKGIYIITAYCPHNSLRFYQIDISYFHSRSQVKNRG